MGGAALTSETIFKNGSFPTGASRKRDTELDFTNPETFVEAVQLVFTHRVELQAALIFMQAALNDKRSGTFSSTFGNERSTDEVRRQRVTQIKDVGNGSSLIANAEALVEILRDDFIRELHLALQASKRRNSELDGAENHSTLRHMSELLARIPQESHVFLRSLFLMAIIVEEGGDLFVRQVPAHLSRIPKEATLPPGISLRPQGLDTNF